MQWLEEVFRMSLLLNVCGGELRSCRKKSPQPGLLQEWYVLVPGMSRNVPVQCTQELAHKKQIILDDIMQFLIKLDDRITIIETCNSDSVNLRK